jgi:uncharacterized membrane protein YciS (DUF1049 family)
MNFASESSKLLTNKYFLYFIVFLAVTNVLGYLASNKLNAVIFFALVSFLASNFSKNMAVILLIALVATNLLMANRTMREGLENATMTDEQKANMQASAEAKAEEKKTSMQETVDGDTDKLNMVDPQLGSGLSKLKASNTSGEAKAALESKAQEKKATITEEGESDEVFEDMEHKPIIDPNNRETKRSSEPETFKAIKPRKTGVHNPKGRSSLSNAAPVNGNTRIDYATTLEDAYTNLEGILGSDGIGKLTNDTQRLMSQQQKLFDTMNTMVPMIETAKNMMDSLDMKQLGGLTDMIKGVK